MFTLICVVLRRTRFYLKKHNVFLTSFFSRFNRDIFSLSEQSHLKEVKNESNLFYI